MGRTISNTFVFLITWTLLNNVFAMQTQELLALDTSNGRLDYIDPECAGMGIWCERLRLMALLVSSEPLSFKDIRRRAAIEQYCNAARITPLIWLSRFIVANGTLNGKLHSNGKDVIMDACELIESAIGDTLGAGLIAMSPDILTAVGLPVSALISQLQALFVLNQQRDSAHVPKSTSWLGDVLYRGAAASWRDPCCPSAPVFLLLKALGDTLNIPWLTVCCGTNAPDGAPFDVSELFDERGKLRPRETFSSRDASIILRRLPLLSREKCLGVLAEHLGREPTDTPPISLLLSAIVSAVSRLPPAALKNMDAHCKLPYGRIFWDTFSSWLFHAQETTLTVSALSLLLPFAPQSPKLGPVEIATLMRCIDGLAWTSAGLKASEPPTRVNDMHNALKNCVQGLTRVCKMPESFSGAACTLLDRCLTTGYIDKAAVTNFLHTKISLSSKNSNFPRDVLRAHQCAWFTMIAFVAEGLFFISGESTPPSLLNYESAFPEVSMKATTNLPKDLSSQFVEVFMILVNTLLTHITVDSHSEPADTRRILALTVSFWILKSFHSLESVGGAQSLSQLMSELDHA